MFCISNYKQGAKKLQTGNGNRATLALKKVISQLISSLNFSGTNLAGPRPKITAETNL